MRSSRSVRPAQAPIELGRRGERNQPGRARRGGLRAEQRQGGQPRRARLPGRLLGAEGDQRVEPAQLAGGAALEDDREGALERGEQPRPALGVLGDDPDALDRHARVSGRSRL